MDKTFLIDVEKCIGCRDCQLACKDEHVGNDWSPIARPQPDTGHFWMRVDERELGVQPRVKAIWMPVLCQHCEKAPCIPSCPETAIYRRQDGIVLIDAGRCTGCKDCMEACPYGVIYFNDELQIAQKCTLCAHLLDQGWKEPRCVTACPTGALVFGDAQGLQGELSMAEAWNPETGAEPAIRYIHLPKPTVVGEVYSPREDLCLEDVEIRLTSLVTGEVISTTSNNYGDFCLKAAKPGPYELTIEKTGYYPKQISPVDLQEWADLGSIRLYPRVP
jgi:Fe-S-cluster-containing dehydrogenase component